MFEEDSPEQVEHVARVRLLEAETRKLHAEMLSALALALLFSVGAGAVALVAYYVLEMV